MKDTGEIIVDVLSEIKYEIDWKTRDYKRTDIL